MFRVAHALGCRTNITCPKAGVSPPSTPMTRTEAVNHTTGGAGRAVVVFTDLDGTLMDHDSYDVMPAKAALQALAARSIPVVPVTSKTRTELVPLMQQLGLSGPAIAENGAVIMNTDGSPDTAVARKTIALALDLLPENIRKAMICFCDMNIEQIAVATGLTHADAARAAAREASEPFMWQGDAPSLTTLIEIMGETLEKFDLRLTQGGRFFHIVPTRDKAAAISALLSEQMPRPQSWVLGDGPNDVSMLLAADRGALIANEHVNTQRLLPADHNLYMSRASGPAGWHEAITAFLTAEFG